MESEIRAYLETLLPTVEELQRLVAPKAPDGAHPNKGWVYDAELGFVHVPSLQSGNGVNGTNTSYDHEEDGARKLVNCANKPCRVHAYGDSFTHCDQVNDGETWQEYLAAHLQEPIRNYGVGAYSVYQAYRRMGKVRDAGERADYIILNIYDDDHFRNISWRGLNVSAGALVRPWPGIPYLQTRPHMRVDVGANTFVERDNPIATADNLHKLRDLDFVFADFGEDPMVYLALAKETEGERSLEYLDNRWWLRPHGAGRRLREYRSCREGRVDSGGSFLDEACGGAGRGFLRAKRNRFDVRSLVSRSERPLGPRWG